MLERLAHLKTTTAGIAISGVFFLVFSSLGCKLPGDWLSWGAATLPAILGILAKDK